MLAFFAFVPYGLTLLFTEKTKEVENILGMIVLVLGTVTLFIFSIALLIREYEKEGCDFLT